MQYCERRYLSLKTTITRSARPMRFMNPEISSPGHMAFVSRMTFHPSFSSVLHICSTTSWRWRDSWEAVCAVSPHAYETKISGLPLGGSSGRDGMSKLSRRLAPEPTVAYDERPTPVLMTTLAL